ncbi:hypothetical protein KY289_035378 [Solanum tuberosum]|nr:hypothetical protein KY289_035378 [Solanum tuberosum]
MTFNDQILLLTTKCPLAKGIRVRVRVRIRVRFVAVSEAVAIHEILAILKICEYLNKGPGPDQGPVRGRVRGGGDSGGIRAGAAQHNLWPKAKFLLEA